MGAGTSSAAGHPLGEGEEKGVLGFFIEGGQKLGAGDPLRESGELEAPHAAGRGPSQELGNPQGRLACS